jgi:hypothetical protein
VNTTDIPAIAWRKSRYSNAEGNCVEVVTWRKSRYSNGSGNCVEIATCDEGPHVSIRDSKDPTGPALTISPAAWRSLTDQVKAGQLG